jgi:hypothetical protein
MSPTTLAPADTDPNVEAAGGDRFVVHRPPRRYPEPLPTGEVVAASLLLSLAAAAVPPLRRRRASRRACDRYLDHLDTVAGTLARAAAGQPARPRPLPRPPRHRRRHARTRRGGPAGRRGTSLPRPTGDPGDSWRRRAALGATPDGRGLPRRAGRPLDLVALGGDLGLHVVLACAAGGAARAAFDPFLRRLHEIGSPGLVMSGDPGDGPLLSGRPAAPLPPGRGLLIRRRGSAGPVQVVWVPPPLDLTGTTGSLAEMTMPAAATEGTTLRLHPP